MARCIDRAVARRSLHIASGEHKRAMGNIDRNYSTTGWPDFVGCQWL
jgi:hypothetical protein